MGIVSLPSFGSDPATVTAALLDGKVDPLATEFNGSIENSNIKAAAGIVYSKLNLASSIVNADISASAAIVASKIDLSSVAQKITMTAKDITEAKCADIASAGTTTIWATDGNYAHITGTTTITSFGTAEQAGDTRTIVFDGILTLTHNATSLILPTGANITTAAGDTAIVRAETTANARVIAYLRKDGTALGAVTAATSLSGSIIQSKLTQSSAVAASTGTAIDDDSIPQLSECPVLTAFNTSITASNGSNTLLITVCLNIEINSSATMIIVAVFLDAGTSAIAAARWLPSSAGSALPVPCMLQFSVSAVDTSAHTYKVGIGGVSGNTVIVNGVSGPARRLGGVLYSSMRIDEIKA